MSGNNSEAVRTAGERLEAIELWGRRTFIAATVGAACLVIMAGATLYAGYVYVRVTTAVSEASSGFARDMGRARAETIKAASRPAPAPRPRAGRGS